VITTGSVDLACPDRSSSKRPGQESERNFEGNAFARQENFVPSGRMLFTDDLHTRPILGAFAYPVLKQFANSDMNPSSRGP
jgi:hypothetical protein